jgi:enoyl-CoA hydratase/carnithine racemase
MGEYEHVLLKREKGTVTITMNRASRRNSLSADHLGELLAAFRETGETDASGIVLAGAGPVLSPPEISLEPVTCCGCAPI